MRRVFSTKNWSSEAKPILRWAGLMLLAAGLLVACAQQSTETTTVKSGQQRRPLLF